MLNKHIWLRCETRPSERRTPLMPSGAAELIKLGFKVTVERCARRIVADEEYEKIGCIMADSGSWTHAEKAAVILGLKELPSQPDIINNSHIYFAHAYKNQTGWQNLLSRFLRGRSEVLDIEYLVKKDNSRVVAFGYYAGYMGAALALLHWYCKKVMTASCLEGGIIAYENADILDEEIKKFQALAQGASPKLLIIGAKGRSGKGAAAIMMRHGVDITCWGREETRNIDRKELLSFDIVINCVFIQKSVPVFIRPEDINSEAKLSVISDVSCDPFSDFNPLPIYNDVTSWSDPYHKIKGVDGKVIDLIAIDNLPSLLPKEASLGFAELLLPHLKTLFDGDNAIWEAAKKSYKNAVSKI